MYRHTDEDETYLGHIWLFILVIATLL